MDIGYQVLVDAASFPTVHVAYTWQSDLAANDDADVMLLRICDVHNTDSCMTVDKELAGNLNAAGDAYLQAPYETDSSAYPTDVADDGSIYFPSSATSAGVFLNHECEGFGNDQTTEDAWANVANTITDTVSGQDATRGTCEGIENTEGDPAQIAHTICLSYDDSRRSPNTVGDGNWLTCYLEYSEDDMLTNCRKEYVPGTWTWAVQTSSTYAYVCHPPGE